MNCHPGRLVKHASGSKRACCVTLDEPVTSPLMDRERALTLIYGAIDAVNQQLPAARRLAKDPATVIVGPGGALDSLGIVTFALALEEQSTDALGRSVTLFKPQWFGDESSPFQSVDRLATFLSTLEHS